MFVTRTPVIAPGYCPRAVNPTYYNNNPCYVRPGYRAPVGYARPFFGATPYNRCWPTASYYPHTTNYYGPTCYPYECSQEASKVALGILGMGALCCALF